MGQGLPCPTERYVPIYVSVFLLADNAGVRTDGSTLQNLREPRRDAILGVR